MHSSSPVVDTQQGVVNVDGAQNIQLVIGLLREVVMLLKVLVFAYLYLLLINMYHVLKNE